MRAWKPFNGLQLYDPEAWQDHVEDPTVFDSPPAMCKKGSGAVRLHCDDDGNYHPKAEAHKEILEAFLKRQGEVVRPSSKAFGVLFEFLRVFKVLESF